MQWVMASRNSHKCREAAEILAPFGIALLSLDAFPGAPEPPEDRDTFEGNAIQKAESARDFTRLAAIADDSGIVVDALEGAPGVHSAYFAGPGRSDDDNNRLLVERLADVPDDRRTAAYICVIALVELDGTVRTFTGETRGRILRSPRGSGGFGYDPFFLSDELGVTFAEAPAGEKHAVSHRGRALRALAEWMTGGKK